MIVIKPFPDVTMQTIEDIMGKAWECGLVIKEIYLPVSSEIETPQTVSTDFGDVTLKK